jgi:hypothetical protein
MAISNAQIQTAINERGAQAVYDAALKQMAGDTARFVDMGFSPNTMGCVHKVMTVAYEQLGDAAKVIDYAKTQAELDAIAKKA